jgi:hypothetical protein
MKRRRGMNSPEITKKRKGEPQIALESPLVSGGVEKKKTGVQCGLEKRSKGFILRGLDMSSEAPDRTCPVRADFQI